MVDNSEYRENALPAEVLSEPVEVATENKLKEIYFQSPLVFCIQDPCRSIMQLHISNKSDIQCPLIWMKWTLLVTPVVAPWTFFQNFVKLIFIFQVNYLPSELHLRGNKSYWLLLMYYLDSYKKLFLAYSQYVVFKCIYYIGNVLSLLFCMWFHCTSCVSVAYVNFGIWNFHLFLSCLTGKAIVQKY